MPRTAASIMQAYCAAKPEFAQAAVDRDAAARFHFGRTNYERYEQSKPKVIAMRAEARRAGIAATFTPVKGNRKVHCNTCNRKVHDFARHNRETHVLDPAMTIYCPIADCPKAVTRDGLITIDDHLASSHSDFRNMEGRGGDMLERSTKPRVLNRLTSESARYVASHRQRQVKEAEMRRASLLRDLDAAGFECPSLAAATLPSDLQQGAVTIADLKKGEAVGHAILARKTLITWGEFFAEAEAMLK